MDRQISREAWMLLHGDQPDDEYESSYRKADRIRELEERGFLPDAPLSAEVMDARRASFGEALQRVMEARRQPYQMEIAGVNPTLMQIRADVPIQADDPRDQQVPAPRYGIEQLELPYTDSSQMTARKGQNGVERQLAILSLLMAANPVEVAPGGGNEVVVTPPAADTNQLPAVEAAVEQAKNSRVPFGPGGRRMAMKYGGGTLAALLGLYGLAALTDGSEPQREYSEAR